MKCNKCSSEMPASGEGVTCSLCEKKFHYECSVRETRWRNMNAETKSKWACSECKSAAPTLSQDGSQGDCDTVSSEEASGIKALLLKMNTRLNALDEVKSSVNTITQSLEFLSGKYDELLREVRQYREDNKELVKEVEGLKRECAEKDKTLSDLSRRFNALEQYGRGVNLEIHGLEQEYQDEQVDTVLQRVAAALGLTYNPAEIQAAHRIPSRSNDRPPMLLVQFVSKANKEKWLRLGKMKRLTSKDVVGVGPQRVYFNENLTPFFGKLFQEARRAVKERQWMSAWVLHGTIRVKKSNEPRARPIIISTFEDLKKIV